MPCTKSELVLPGSWHIICSQWRQRRGAWTCWPQHGCNPPGRRALRLTVSPLTATAIVATKDAKRTGREQPAPATWWKEWGLVAERFFIFKQFRFTPIIFVILNCFPQLWLWGFITLEHLIFGCEDKTYVILKKTIGSEIELTISWSLSLDDPRRLDLFLSIKFTALLHTARGVIPRRSSTPATLRYCCACSEENVAGESCNFSPLKSHGRVRQEEGAGAWNTRESGGGYLSNKQGQARRPSHLRSPLHRGPPISRRFLSCRGFVSRSRSSGIGSFSSLRFRRLLARAIKFFPLMLQVLLIQASVIRCVRVFCSVGWIAAFNGTYSEISSMIHLSLRSLAVCRFWEQRSLIQRRGTTGGRFSTVVLHFLCLQEFSWMVIPTS